MLANARPHAIDAAVLVGAGRVETLELGHRYGHLSPVTNMPENNTGIRIGSLLGAPDWCHGWLRRLCHQQASLSRHQIAWSNRVA